ncbi:AAA family ATPase, partial [Leucobacter sp. M11]
LEAGREAHRAAKAETAELFQQMRAQESERNRARDTRNRLQVRAEAAQAEAERLAQALGATEPAEAEALSAAETARAQLADAESRPRPILDVTQRDALLEELDAARALELTARLALETHRERLRAAREQAERLAEQLDRERRAAEEAARRSVLRARQRARASRVADALPGLRAAVDRSLAEARQQQVAAEQERARTSQELTLVRSEEAELRERLRLLTEQTHRAELTSYERKLQLSSLLERAGSELGLVEDVLVAEYGPDQLVPLTPGSPEEPAAEAEPDEGHEDTPGVPYVRAEQEARLRRAERQLTELGRINPLALEEYAALEQRHRFLTEQLTDLTKTRQDLLSIIADLDEQMEGIFAAAFADTQAAFAEVFPVLFPGGSGEIALSDPGDLLSTGIEMTVRPAGKKVERLSLLSGGERSLAAVAWLIAIFKARPSPFYIMDEVEAALDDANLGRLLQVFEGLRATSQLIVITHQKRTMEIADALYGVSMRQDGISAVVGQRMASREAGTETE